jgi:hypothetical protein
MEGSGCRLVSEHPLDRERITKLVPTIFADDLHAKRVVSLANAAVGVLEGAALGIHAIGQALAFHSGLDSRHAAVKAGSVVPVLDLAVKFGLPETAVTKRTRILIVEAALGVERGVVGVMADTVQEVLELGPSDIEPPPSFGTHVRVDYLVGLERAAGGFVVLLDLDCVIRASEEELALTPRAVCSPAGQGSGGPSYTARRRLVRAGGPSTEALESESSAAESRAGSARVRGGETSAATPPSKDTVLQGGDEREGPTDETPVGDAHVPAYQRAAGSPSRCASCSAQAAGL